MQTSPANVIACLAGELLAEENLVIEAIREDSDMLALFRDVVADFTEYPTLLAKVNEVI
jgi:hypothetical protein